MFSLINKELEQRNSLSGLREAIRNFSDKLKKSKKMETKVFSLKKGGKTFSLQQAASQVEKGCKNGKLNNGFWGSAFNKFHPNITRLRQILFPEKLFVLDHKIEKLEERKRPADEENAEKWNAICNNLIAPLQEEINKYQQKLDEMNADSEVSQVSQPARLAC